MVITMLSVLITGHSRISWDQIFDDTQLFWNIIILMGELLGFLAIIVSLIVAIRNMLLRIMAPYRQYIDTIDYSMGRNTRKRIEKYYIPTCGQDVDPCNQEEIYKNQGNYKTFRLIPFLCREAFARDSQGKYYLILADSGMGKTTFLIRLYREYVLMFSTERKLRIYYIPLSDPRCLVKIENINDKQKSILLLDAYDENTEAINDRDDFFQTLLECTVDFNKVVISCRTQFFSNQRNEPEKAEYIQAGIGNKSAEVVKKYISPFTDKEVRKYLKKRFRFNVFFRKKAERIVTQVPFLMARPLILDWIDCLINDKKEYTCTYQIYETIIRKWIEREPQIITGEKGEKVWIFSKRVAKYMLEHETTIIPEQDIEIIAKENDIKLPPIIAKSRSLLNRNSNGEYKFAHRSFLEFFLAEDVICNATIPDNEIFINSLSGYRRFLVEGLLDACLRKESKDTFLRAFSNPMLPMKISFNEILAPSTTKVYAVREKDGMLQVKTAFFRKEWVDQFTLNRYTVSCVISTDGKNHSLDGVRLWQMYLGPYNNTIKPMVNKTQSDTFCIKWEDLPDGASNNADKYELISWY